MLDVRRLRVLREVATRGSFSAAADALHFTQSAVSQQIAALEREAGTPLVERNARGVRLTRGGRGAGPPHGRHPRTPRGRGGGARGDRRPAPRPRAPRLFPSAGATIAPAAIARFREAHPGVEFSLVPAEPPRGVEKLRAGEVMSGLLIARRSPAWPTTGSSASRSSTTRCTSCLPRATGGVQGRLRLEDLVEERVAARLDRDLPRHVDLPAGLRARGLRAADRVPLRRLPRDPGLRRCGHRRPR